MSARVVSLVGTAERIAGRGNNADASPIGVNHLHHLAELPPGLGIASGFDDPRVAVVEEMPFVPQLAYDRVHGGQQRIGGEARDCRRNVVPGHHELPLLGSHHGRNVPGSD